MIGAGALTLASTASVTQAAPRTRLASLAALVPGKPVVVNYPKPDAPVVLVKLGRVAKGGVGPDRDVVGFSMLCTHQGCPVQFSEGRLLCPCHYSLFDPAVGGQCYQGPAPRGLPQVVLEVVGDDVFALGATDLAWGEVSDV